MMRVKKLGAALVVVAALGAAISSSALAAAVTQDVKWYTGSGSGVALGSTESVSVTQSYGRATFFVEIAGVEYELEWNNTECSGCTIYNSEGTAFGLGKLKFKGLTVLKPAGCHLAAGSSLTRGLILQADWMKAHGVEPNYWKFWSGVGVFTEFEFVGCPQALNIVPEGVVFFETENHTGVQAQEQIVTTSEAINTAANGAHGALHVGTSAAELTIALKFIMTGAHVGEPFGTH